MSKQTARRNQFSIYNLSTPAISIYMDMPALLSSDSEIAMHVIGSRCWELFSFAIGWIFFDFEIGGISIDRFHTFDIAQRQIMSCFRSIIIINEGNYNNGKSDTYALCYVFLIYFFYFRS